MGDLTGKRILVTGGTGFLGRHLCNRLAERTRSAIVVTRRSKYDLTEQASVRAMLDDNRPEIVIHLAAACGGIGANSEQPGRYFYDNAVMGILLMEEARRRGVEKFVGIGTICSYPKHTAVPFQENALWDGYPEETNAPYGIAKKALLVQAQAYRKQYGFNAITLLPANLYGPGDNFDPATSHVIPSLIRKVLEARNTGQLFLDVWGSGSASREFLYVRDAADAIVLAADGYNDPDPVNLGSGQEITIAALVDLICRLCGYRGTILWDPTMPDGQPRRCVDTTRAREGFGFVARTRLEDGLLEMIDWYERVLGGRLTE